LYLESITGGKGDSTINRSQYIGGGGAGNLEVDFAQFGLPVIETNRYRCSARRPLRVAGRKRKANLSSKKFGWGKWGGGPLWVREGGGS